MKSPGHYGGVLVAANFKSVKCTACQEPIQVGSNTHKARLCGACRVRNYVENLVAMKTKSGPLYEAQQLASREGMERKARGGGPQS